MTQFKHLFSKLHIGNTELQNRILSTAHQTNHVIDGIPTEDMDAYHVARAKGGLGLIVLEAAAVHSSGMLTTNTINGYCEEIVDAYKRLANKIHPYGTKIFTQLFHGGREVVSSTYRNAAYSASYVQSLRFGTMTRAINVEEDKDIIDGYASYAIRYMIGSLDGLEFCYLFGYIPSLL